MTRRTLFVLLIILGSGFLLASIVFLFDALTSTQPAGLGTVILDSFSAILTLISFVMAIREKRKLDAGGSISAKVDSTNSIMVAGNNNLIVINKDAKLVSPNQIPLPPSDFTGRSVTIRRLMKLVNGKKTNYILLHGMGGIGKTSLGLRLAALLNRNYPDGQIFLDLHGVDVKNQIPLTAAQILVHIIRSVVPNHPIFQRRISASTPPKSFAQKVGRLINQVLGLPNELSGDDIFDRLYDSGELISIYRSLLHEKRFLIFFDNAFGADQLSAITPPDSCLILVTSRWKFYLPCMYSFDLDIMSLSDSTALVKHIAKSVTKVQATIISRQCGFLPLAIRVASSILVRRNDISAEMLIKRLDEKAAQLSLVEASIQLSYDLLRAEFQKKLRQLCLCSDITFEEILSIWSWTTNIPKSMMYILTLSAITPTPEGIAFMAFYCYIQILLYGLFQFPNPVYFIVQVSPIILVFILSTRLANYEPKLIPKNQIEDDLGVLLDTNLITYDKNTKRYKIHDLTRIFLQKQLSRSKLEMHGISLLLKARIFRLQV